MADAIKDLLASFPDDVPTAPLLTISLKKLQNNIAQEHDKLFEACQSLGFFYLDMAGCEDGDAILSQSNDMFDLMKSFYDLPVEEKLKYDFAAEGSYFGYKGMGAEVIDGKGTKDKNEIYNISKDDLLLLTPPVPAHDVINDNRQSLTSYTNANNRILTTLFHSLEKSLSLPKSTLTSLHRLTSPSGCHIRFIRAPPQPPQEATLALGEHTDFGSLTILFNRLGGLQVQLPHPSNEWVYVRPMPGCAIINLGDAMVKFTAGILRSNLHRVVNPPGKQGDLVRYSLVYFSRPEHDVRMGRIKGGLIDAAGEDMDDEIGGSETTREWLKRRHQGRKVQFFKGAESWEGAKGTEARL